MLKRIEDFKDQRQDLLRQVRTSTAPLAPAFAFVWRWKGTVVAAITLALAVPYVLVPAILGPVVAVTPVIRADLIKTVVASGHVQAPFRVKIASQVTGIVARVAVAEGQSVKAGEPLIYLDDREAQAAVTLAEGVVAQSEARVQQMRELVLPSAEQSLAQAKATLESNQKTFDRAATLAKSGYGTQAALDEATRALDVARAILRNAEFQVYTSRPGGSDYVMADTLLSQAKANLESARWRLGYSTIVAPRAGVLISRNVEAGNVAQPGAKLMELSPDGDTELIVLIDEKNLSQLQIGQKALVSADAYPKQIFPAELVYINPGVDLQSATVEVKLRVPNPPEYLRQDMTVSVDIEVAQRPNALIANAGSVHDLNTAHPWVLDGSTGRATRREITVGMTDANNVEILSGIDEQAQLVPVSMSDIAPGKRLRPRAQSGAPP